MQQNDTGLLSFTAGEDLVARRRVKLSGATERTIVYADAGEPALGVTQANADSGDPINVKLIFANGSFEIEAAGVITANAKVYGAADGKVSETVSGDPEWQAREAASGDGSIIEFIPLSAGGIAAGGSDLDWQESVVDRLTVPGGSEAVGYRALVISAATGVFATHEDDIAILEEDATWTFIEPTEGFAVAVEDENVKYSYNGSAWVVVANIVELTDSTTGTASNILAATPGVMILCFPIPDMVKLADADIVTDFVPGFAGKILKAQFVVEDPVTNAAKACDLDIHVAATPITGGQIELTSANCTPLGAVIAGAAITALNTFTAVQAISVVGSSTTAFIEGSGSIQLTIENTDVSNALASLAAKQTAILAGLEALGWFTP